MTIDLAALRAKMAARKVEETKAPELPATTEVTQAVLDVPVPEQKVVDVIEGTPIVLGTQATTEIDHLDFLTKIDQLEQALIHTHPHMPVLLMKIHKQISADPELVTVLTEDQIGIIVSGLKVQTKTELTGTILKQPASRAKKTKLDLDMF